MNRFKELNVWKKAVDLSLDIYKMTDSFPEKEKFNLISQINRSSISIPSNIAEGAGRDGKKDFNRFLSIAVGSSFELETQLIIAERLNYIDNNKMTEVTKTLNEVQNMIFGLKRSLK